MSASRNSFKENLFVTLLLILFSFLISFLFRNPYKEKYEALEEDYMELEEKYEALEEDYMELEEKYEALLSDYESMKANSVDPSSFPDPLDFTYADDYFRSYEDACGYVLGYIEHDSECSDPTMVENAVNYLYDYIEEFLKFVRR